MDVTTIIILVVVVLVALYLYNRSRRAPQGTYDDQKTRSSGSIGGGTRGHDDAKVRSSGSIGGETRGYDTPTHASQGSIGGSAVPPGAMDPRVGVTDRPDALRQHAARPGDEATLQREESIRRQEEFRRDKSQHLDKEDDQFRSKGSFGG